MKYSIVVPVHNAEPYLRQCVESVLSQDVNDLELVLVDDGSEDLSGEICDEYAIKDRRVAVIHQNCQGVSVARNKGIEIASGEYIVFLDADDYWISDNVLSCIDIDGGNADIVKFNYAFVYDYSMKNSYLHFQSIDKMKKQYSSGELFLKDALTDDPEYPWYSVIYAYRRSLWNWPEVLRFPQDVRYHEDVDVVYRVILRAQKVIVLSACLYAYRKWYGAVSRENSLELLKDRITVNKRQIEYIENNSDLHDPLKTLLCNNMATAYYTVLINVDALERNDQKEIKEYLRQEAPFFCRYPATVKQKAVNFMLRFCGLSATCRLLHIRRKIKNAKGSLPKKWIIMAKISCD